MKDLTFGEQVKIILSRKGMTIKELAERIQEETGKAMSRQNLTQRLGRDNFQEQDMRMIAAILGCPFRLSIFPTDNEEEFNIEAGVVLDYAKKSSKKKKVDSEEIYQQELVFDETMTASVAEQPAEEVLTEKAAAEEAAPVEEVLIEEAAEEILAEEVIKAAPEEAAEEILAEEAAEAAPEEAAEEILAEEVIEAAPEEAAEEILAEEVIEAAPEEVVEEIPVEEAVETVEVQDVAAEEDITIGEVYEMQEGPFEEIEEPEPVKQDRFRTGSIFLRGFGRNKNKKNKKAEKNAEPVEEVQPVVEKKPRQVITPESEDFEPVLMHIDAEEDLTIGEMNPYTGREYQSNSVRMHPTRIGYVQVYDRSKHGWEEMTEWAFLGYQEQKKAMLGRDYEPPIYLD